jgi:anhydro-N-acetylmuramic acid kinase
MRVIGLMSGTSYDAIDVAAAELGLHGDVVTMRPLGALSVPFDEDLRTRIAGGLPPAQTSYEQVCVLDTELGQAFGDAAARGIDELCAGAADLVVSHGQTVYHWVDEDGRARGTLQLGQPAWVAEHTGLPVVSDLRSRDIARGGHGAPLVSMFDVLLLAGRPGRCGALNLGGIANLTVVDGDGHAVAFDAGPANALIDAATSLLRGEPFDADGQRAARGRVDDRLLAALLDHPYFAQPAPKSTGKELFHWGYVRDRLSSEQLAADDIIATLTELSAQVVATELERHRVDEVFVSGGGARNRWLLQRLASLAPSGCRLTGIADLGFGPEEKEAYAFALLGFLTLNGLPATVPSCTGASTPSMLGSITPGAASLRLPEPAQQVPVRLKGLPTELQRADPD